MMWCNLCTCTVNTVPYVVELNPKFYAEALLTFPVGPTNWLAMYTSLPEPLPRSLFYKLNFYVAIIVVSILLSTVKEMWERIKLNWRERK